MQKLFCVSVDDSTIEKLWASKPEEYKKKCWAELVMLTGIETLHRTHKNRPGNEDLIRGL